MTLKRRTFFRLRLGRIQTAVEACGVLWPSGWWWWTNRPALRQAFHSQRMMINRLVDIWTIKLRQEDLCPAGFIDVSCYFFGHFQVIPCWISTPHLDHKDAKAASARARGDLFFEDTAAGRDGLGFVGTCVFGDVAGLPRIIQCFGVVCLCLKSIWVWFNCGVASPKLTLLFCFSDRTHSSHWCQTGKSSLSNSNRRPRDHFLTFFLQWSTDLRREMCHWRVCW